MSFQRWMLVAAGAAIGGGIVPIHPVAAHDRSTALETRTFDVPHDFLWGGRQNNLATISDPIGYAPAVPETAKDRLEVLKLSKQPWTAQKVLSAQGISFPSGAHAIYVPSTRTLTVRNTLENLSLVSNFVASLKASRPTVLALVAHLVEAPGPLLRLLAANTGDAGDQTQDLQRLRTEADKDTSRVKVLHTLFVETRPGQHCTFESVTEHEYTGNLELDKKGRASIEAEMQTLGFRFEVDPTIGPQGEIELNIGSAFTVLWEEPKQESATEPVSGGPLELAIPEFQSGKISTALKLKSGQTRLIGMWPAKGDPGLRARDISQAVFLTAHAVPQEMANSISSLAAIPIDPGATIEHTFVLPSEFFDLNNGANLESALKNSGFELPKESEVRLDDLQRVVVRTTSEHMPVFEARLQQYEDLFPKSACLTIEVVRASAKLVRPLVQEASSQSDHAFVLRKLKALPNGSIKSSAVSYVESNEKSRVSVQSHLDRHFLTELSWISAQQPAWEAVRRNAGLNFEAETSMSGLGGEGGRIIGLNLALERHFAAPSPWREQLSDPASKRRFKMPRDEFHLGHVQTAVWVMDGNTKMIGVWRPIGEGGKVGDDVLDAAFLTCRVVRHLPGSGAQATRSKMVPPLAIAKDASSDMLTRIFKVSGDFFNEPHNPFDTAARQPPLLKRIEDILKGNGIEFPPGAEIITRGAAANQLIVRNTPANLAKIEAFIDKLARNKAASVRVTAHLFEAPAATIHHLLAQHERQNDHAGALAALVNEVQAGTAVSLGTSTISTIHGQRAAVEQVSETSVLNAIRIRADGTPQVIRESISIGTLFEVEPAVAADGALTLACTLVHHPAAPVSRSENLGTAGDSAIHIPLTDVHVAEYQGYITMFAGTARILAVWKPTGKPEFEEKDLLHIAILEAAVVPVEE